MSIGTTDEQRGLRTAIADWAERVHTTAVVRASETPAETPPGSPPGSSLETPAETPPAAESAEDKAEAGWRRCWSGVVALGLPGLALPEEVGGAGGTTVDLAVAAEQAADSLIPGPLLPVLLAGQLLAMEDTAPIAKELLPGLAEGRTVCAVAWDTGGLVATTEEPGQWSVSGPVGPVLGAADADQLILGARLPDGGELWFAVDAEDAALSIAARTPVDFSRSLAEVTVRGCAVPGRRVLPGLRTARVREWAALLAVAEAAGVAGWCLRTASAYAKVREQFGRPIGSFQAVKHLLVDMLCRVEQATALAWDAARADVPGERAFAVAAAAGFALDAAVDTAKDCVQVLGGIGFTWEHDAHLYLRRALALRALLGGGARWRRRAAELALAGQRHHRGIALPPGQVDADRAEVRRLVNEIAALPVGQQRTRLADSGLLAPHWPAPYGRDASAADQLAIDEELTTAGVRRPDLVIGGWAAPTILRHGTDAQRERFVGPTLRGEITWCQLFSEPGAGSDLAALRTRAEAVEGGWRISGQKVWTSLATVADWAICLARTDPDVPKHRGISYFLVDMRSAGIDIRPLREITGDAVFNEVFLDNVFVPEDCLVGPVHGGWRLARTTLANERVAMSGGSSLGEGVERLLERVRLGGAPDDVVLDRLGALVTTALATAALDQRGALRSLDGREPGAESSVRKLVGVAHRQAVAEAALELGGPRGATADGPLGPVLHEFLLTRCLSIAGGTSQILRTVAAERVLGMPREPSAG